MILITLAGTSFVVALSGALMPGPLLAVTVDRAVRRGWKAGPLVSAGHAALEAGLLAVVVLGFGNVLRRPPVMAGISVVGGLLLVWMGQNMVRTARSLDLSPAGGRGGSPVLDGILVSASSTYWILWWVTVGLAYVGLALPLGAPGVAAFFLGHVAADFAWYTAVSAAVAGGRNRIPPALYRGLTLGCGIFLVLLGIRFIVRPAAPPPAATRPPAVLRPSCPGRGHPGIISRSLTAEATT